MVRFDPHSLAYFRIAQLEGLEEPEKIKHTFLKSVKDVLKKVFFGHNLA